MADELGGFGSDKSKQEFIQNQLRKIGGRNRDLESRIISNSPKTSTGKKYKKLPFCPQHPKKRLEFHKEYKNPDEYDTPYYCRKGDEWIDREDILWRKILIK